MEEDEPIVDEMQRVVYMQLLLEMLFLRSLRRCTDAARSTANDANKAQLVLCL